MVEIIYKKYCIGHTIYKYFFHNDPFLFRVQIQIKNLSTQVCGSQNLCTEFWLCNQFLNIFDDADGGEIVAEDVFAL